MQLLQPKAKKWMTRTRLASCSGLTACGALTPGIGGGDKLGSFEGGAAELGEIEVAGEEAGEGAVFDRSSALH